MYSIIIDGGTTNTRVFLVKDGIIAGKAARPVGVRNTAIDGNNTRLKEAVVSAIGEVISLAEKKFDDRLNGELHIDMIVALGMITSPLGLYNLPHISAPAGRSELAKASVSIGLDEIFGIQNKMEIIFIPGIRSEFDFMRGEETQTMGLIEEERIDSKALVVFLGSHTKFIKVDEQGRITGSLTTMAGEIVNALKSSTILSSSLPVNLPSNAEKIEMDMVHQGCNDAMRQGFTRTAFRVRLLDQINGYTDKECFDYLSGMIAGEDLKALSCWDGALDAEVVYIIGNGYRAKIYEELLRKATEELGFCAIVIKSFAGSDDKLMDRITVRGALSITDSRR